MKLALCAFTLALLSGCGGGGLGAAPMTAEAFCATLPPNGYGNAFFCGTTQANLARTNFPDGSQGYCMYAGENLGLVGYSVTTYNGGAYLVTSQSSASTLSGQLGNQSPGYIRCTRQ